MAGQSHTAAKSAARMAAVQALFQIDASGQPASAVIKEFTNHRLEDGVDADLFKSIVEARAVSAGPIDEKIGATLKDGWSVNRLDPTVRAILRCANQELMHRAETPAKVILAEYVAIADAFFSGKEPGFVNASLDKSARALRPSEFGS